MVARTSRICSAGRAYLLGAMLLWVASAADGADAPPVAAPLQPAPAAKQDLPRQTIDLGGGVTFEMVRIPAGEFDMGSPASEEGRDPDETLHRVRITKPYWLATTEVTQAVWEAVMRANPSAKQGPTLPVTDVSWDDCQAFVRRLNEKVAGGGFRLPTEAEWEYACRAESRTRFCFGDDEKTLAESAWYGESAAGSVHPVRGLKPNVWGLYDMHGNAGEWCADMPADYVLPADGPLSDPVGATRHGTRVVRGGSWFAPSGYLRCANRGSHAPEVANRWLGLRIARVFGGDTPHPKGLDAGLPAARPPGTTGPSGEAAKPAPTPADLTWTTLTSTAQFLREVEAAGKAGKATVVEVWADWCAYSLKYDRLMQTTPAVNAAFSRLVRLRLDVSKEAVPWEQAVRARLGIPPHMQPFMVFIDAKGRIRRDLDLDRWMGDRAEGELLRRAEAVERDP